MDFKNEMRLWRKLSITGLIGVVVYILFIIVGSFLWRATTISLKRSASSPDLGFPVPISIFYYHI